jgi:hypothetical protein
MPADSASEILSGLTPELSGMLLRDRLGAFCRDLDALGRLDGEGEAWLDEGSLRTMLRRVLGEPATDALVSELRRFPDQRLAGADSGGRPASWFAFAGCVTIFDGDRSAAFAELELADDAARWAIVDAVQARFPSLEEELIDPEVVPPAIERFMAPGSDGDEARRALLSYLVRQLGWWAAAAFALLVPGAMYQQRRAHGHDATAGMTHPWPIFTYVSAATIGGWTLTVVENCLLATDSDHWR